MFVFGIVFLIIGILMVINPSFFVNSRRIIKTKPTDYDIGYYYIYGIGLIVLGLIAIISSL